MRKIKNVVMSMLLAVGIAAGTPMASMAALNSSAYQSNTVHMMNGGWTLDVNSMKKDTRAIMSEIANGGTVCVMPSGTSCSTRHTKYSMSTYRDYLQMLKDTGRFDLIDLEIDQTRGDRSVITPSRPFLVELQWQSINLENEMNGNPVIDLAVQQIVQSAGVTEGMDKRDAARRLAVAVADFYEYDPATKFTSMEESVRTRKGVCRQYATLFQYACENCDIPCARIMGADKEHEWNITCINGVNEYTDATYYDKLRRNDYILMNKQDMLLKGGYDIAPNVIWGAGN